MSIGWFLWVRLHHSGRRARWNLQGCLRFDTAVVLDLQLGSVGAPSDGTAGDQERSPRDDRFIPNDD